MILHTPHAGTGSVVRASKHKDDIDSIELQLWLMSHEHASGQLRHLASYHARCKLSLECRKNSVSQRPRQGAAMVCVNVWLWWE